jgi:hypothetical protein
MSNCRSAPFAGCCGISDGRWSCVRYSSKAWRRSAPAGWAMRKNCTARCCARAARGHAAATPANAAIKSRRLMGSPSGRPPHPTTLVARCASQQGWRPMSGSGQNSDVGARDCQVRSTPMNRHLQGRTSRVAAPDGDETKPYRRYGRVTDHDRNVTARIDCNVTDRDDRDVSPCHL